MRAIDGQVRVPEARMQGSHIVGALLWAGLTVSGPFAIVAVIELITSDGSPESMTFVPEPQSWRGELVPNDPDGSTIRAEFVPIETAIELLEASPWGLGEAIVRALGGSPEGGIWVYRWRGGAPWEGGGPAELVLGLEAHA